jgi:hypothetical protein
VQQTQLRFIFFFKHDHLKNASFLKHDRFNVHDEKIAKKINSLHDEIENESKLELYIDIHEVDADHEEKRITTTSRVKKH